MLLRLHAFRSWAPLLALLPIVSIAGCPSLGDIPLGECGNGVREADLGEECDPAVDAPSARVAGEPFCARPPADDACHWVWDDTTCCPQGTTAGIDGRCRTGSGVFDTLPIPITEEPVLGAETADVDGDGVRDLAIRYVSNEIEIIPLGPATTRSPIRDSRPAEPFARPAFGSLGDSVTSPPDLCGRPTAFPSGAVFIPTNEGVRVLIASDGAPPLPKAFANLEAFQLVLPTVLPGAACGSEYEELEGVFPSVMVCPGAIARNLGGELEIAAVDPANISEEQPRRLLGLPGDSPSDVVGRVEVVRMPDYAGCDGFAVRVGAEQGPSQLIVAGTCADAAGSAETLATFDVPPGARTFVRDADEDGDSDVVIVELGSMRILFGDGAGAFGGALGEVEVSLPDYDDAVLPLTVGHIDDDGRLDIVDPYFVWATAGRCANYEECAFTASGVYLGRGELREAVIADVTGDGRQDVVGVIVDDDEQLGVAASVAVASASSSGVHAFDLIPTAAPSRDLWVADFDGDGVDDVVMIAPSAERCVVPDRIVVLFGEVGRDPMLVGTAEIQGIEGIAAGPIVPFGRRFDGAGDLGLSTSCPPTDERSGFAASILYGNPDRGFDSPVKLPRSGQSASTIQFATGRVVGDDDHPDLVAVGPNEDVDNGLGIWAIEATGEADLSLERVLPVPTGLFGADFALATGDFDCRADRTGECVSDEVVIFQPTYDVPDSDDGGAYFVTPEPRLAYLTSPTDVSVSPDCTSVVGPRVELESAFPSAFPYDVDGDGWLDVVAWWTTIPGQPPRGAAWVYFHDGMGPANACPVLIEVPDGEVVLSIATIGVGSGDPALVLGTNGGAHLLRPGKARTVDACRAGTSACSRIPVDPTTSDVAVVDFDLDGLDDLAVTTAQGLEIQLQKSLDVLRSQTQAESND